MPLCRNEVLICCILWQLCALHQETEIVHNFCKENMQQLSKQAAAKSGVILVKLISAAQETQCRRTQQARHGGTH